MPRVFRLSIMGLLALALSGCFVSKTALIQPDQAAPIFDGKTGYSRSSLGDDGQTWVEDEKGSISKVDGGYVARSNEEKDDAPITLRRLQTSLPKLLQSFCSSAGKVTAAKLRFSSLLTTLPVWTNIWYFCTLLRGNK